MVNVHNVKVYEIGISRKKVRFIMRALCCILISLVCAYNASHMKLKTLRGFLALMSYATLVISFILMILGV